MTEERPEDIVKRKVGLVCPDSGVYELLEPAGLTRWDLQRSPHWVAVQITEYLDELVRNP